MTTSTLARGAGLVLAAAALVSLVGCEAPAGKSRGRVSPGETTDAEIGSGQMYIADLNDASDRIGESLMKDLSYMAENDLKSPDGQAYECTLVYGDISNKASRMPTTDFEVVRERLRDSLIGSKEFRRHFRVIESRARWEQLNSRELGDQSDPLQRGKAGTNQRGINPAYTYFLNGNAFSIDRGTTKAFYLNFQLMRSSDSTIVFSKKYEQTYK